jgi:hypothetical protein
MKSLGCPDLSDQVRSSRSAAQVYASKGACWRVGAGKGASGQAGGLHFGGRPGTADCLPVLGLPARRRTHFARFALCVQTDGDKSVHEARCARGPAALRSSAPKRRPPACPNAPLRHRLLCLRERTPTVQLAAGGTRRGRFLGRRGAEVQGRRACALCRLTCRSCLNEMSKANGVSSAARPWAEHRSAVGVPADRPSMSPRRVPPAASRATR